MAQTNINQMLIRRRVLNSSYLGRIVFFSSCPWWLQHGFSDIKVEDTPKGHLVLFQDVETLIRIEEDSTHIMCENDESLRVKLQDLVLKFLQKF